MGNSKSVVSQGVKQQAAGDGSKSHSLYKLIDLKGGGELVELMKKASRTKDYREIDEKIRTCVKPFLYNGGEGELVPTNDLVKIRSKDRQSLKVEKPKQAENDDVAMVDLVTDQQGNHVSQKPRKKYRFVCWQIDKIGAVGETALHLCLLNSTSTHADLAKRLLRIFPNLIKDIYLSEEYYGESVLHMAIVNEDPALVKFFLDRGADVRDRCCGSFFCPDDQKDSRRDHPSSEYVHVCKETSYEGYTYWGEYALGFAACLGQEECVRLLIAKGADPNVQDNNGNTVLHMLVIHDKKEMFDLIYHLGGRLDIKNRQGLTPLTLAAKLARKDMYEHILEIEREVYWVFGDVTCAGYPLQEIDTISASGEINKDSALYQIVQGEQMGHLDMLDGIVSQLLQEKWKTFARFRFYRRFAIFILYFIIFATGFLLRPGKDGHPSYKLVNVTTADGNVSLVNNTVSDPCYLIRGQTTEDILRYVLECLTVIGACSFLILAANEIYHQNLTIFFMTLKAAPTKSLFLLSCILVVLMVPGRAACSSAYEDVMGVLAILFTAPYFLFFCRGFTMVGPFVVMIYKMIKGDLLRFFTIYVVFLIGFSQAMFVIFRRKPEEETIFSHPIEAMMGMFIMSLGEFGDIYEQFDATAHPDLGKLVFVLHMVLVTLLLVNMLIAMMGNTYTLVSQTQKEYLRQWAKIVLVMEQTVSTGARRNKQMGYSQPMADGRRALVTRWHQTESEREEMKRLREMHRLHKKNILRRKASRKGLKVEVSPAGLQNV